MSSILEALRELDSQRPPATPGVTAPAEPPAAGSRALETLGVAAIGLAIGVLGFVLFVVFAAFLRSAPPEKPPTPSPAAKKVVEAERTSGPPAWLEMADPPRARVTGQPLARSEAAPPAKRERPAPESRVSGAPELAIATIDYSPDVANRSVTLQVGGATVRLRERESAHGIEVQSIQPDGVYVRRGGDVFMLTPAP